MKRGPPSLLTNKVDERTHVLRAGTILGMLEQACFILNPRVVP